MFQVHFGCVCRYVDDGDERAHAEKSGSDSGYLAAIAVGSGAGGVGAGSARNLSLGLSVELCEAPLAHSNIAYFSGLQRNFTGYFPALYNPSCSSVFCTLPRHKNHRVRR